MSKILLYQEPTTGVTTNGTQHAFFIDENGIPTVKNGSSVIQFGTSGYAFAGSSGSSGMNGTNGLSGTSGISGTSGQDGAPGDIGPSGSSGSSGESGTSGINGIDGVSGTSGISYGTSGISGTSGVSGVSLGAKSKAGSISITGFTYNATTQAYEYEVVFAEAFGSNTYSTSINLVDNSEDNLQDPYNYYPTWISLKTETGFKINTLGDPSFYPTVTVEWTAISWGETGVPVYGSAGSSGSSGANGSGGSGGGGGDTLYTQQVSVAASQPAISYSGVQWRSIYGDGNNLDQGSGGQYDGLEVGFIQPFFLAPGETIEKVGFYFMDYTNTGTAEFKVIICDKHPHAYLPWNLLHTETLTFAHDDVDNKFISWDYDFTNTGSTVNTYFVYILFAEEATRTFEICRTVQYPQHLTYDYRIITSDNRYNANSHWVTGYTNIYNSLPATMSSVLSTNLFYNNQRGGHMYYQTSRP